MASKAQQRRQKAVVIFIAIATTVSLAGLGGALFGGVPPNNPNQQQVTDVDIVQIEQITGVPCLPGGTTGPHPQLAFHIHPQLTLTIDGVDEPVRPSIGVVSGCMQEIHTHESDGQIHVESFDDKTYAFADFLRVWGLVDLQQDGYTTRLTVDGEFNDNDTSFSFTDGQQINLEFITIPDFSAPEPESQ